MVPNTQCEWAPSHAGRKGRWPARDMARDARSARCSVGAGRGDLSRFDRESFVVRGAVFSSSHTMFFNDGRVEDRSEDARDTLENTATYCTSSVYHLSGGTNRPYLHPVSHLRSYGVSLSPHGGYTCQPGPAVDIGLCRAALTKCRLCRERRSICRVEGAEDGGVEGEGGVGLGLVIFCFSFLSFSTQWT